MTDHQKYLRTQKETELRKAKYRMFTSAPGSIDHAIATIAYDNKRMELKYFDINKGRVGTGGNAA